MKKIFPLLALAALVCSALCCVPTARAEEKAKDAAIIYPRQPETNTQTPAATRSGDSNYLLLVLATAAAATGGWMLWRQRRSPGGLAGRQATKLNVAESRSLGNRQYLVVADYDGKKFLLGVCPGSITMLTPLPDDEDGAPRA